MTPTISTADTLLNEDWMLSPGVALRPEPFGALAYHFGNRRLIFLKKPEVVSLVEALDRSRDVREALQTVGLPKHHWPAYLTALRRFIASDMLRPTKGTTR